MEPRILLSADALGGAIDADSLSGDKTDPITAGTAERLDALLASLPKQRDNDNTDAVNLDNLADFAPSNSDTRLELVFVDASIDDYESLLEGLAADRDGSEFHVHVLDATRDGIEQITDVLAQQTGVNAVHVLSHGNERGLQLGASWLDNDSLAGYRDSISSWSDALDQDADILLYGCNLAASDQGVALLESLVDFTDADVAASEDLTGSAALSGDWDLEYKAGSIETAVAINSVSLQWSGTLAVISDNFDTGDFTGGSGWTGDWQEPGDVPPTPHAGPGAGDIQVNDNFAAGDQALQVQGVGDAALREVDLSTAVTATLTFDYARVNMDPDDIVYLDIWDGSIWTNAVKTYNNANDTVWQQESIDISGYADANTQIRFRSEAMGDTVELFYIDDIQITTSTVVNDAPTASGVPADVVVTEDTLSDFDLSGVTFADADGDSLTVTLQASAGTFTAASGGSVTVGGSGSNTLTLDGTAADINTFLDTTSNIRYTGASNASGTDAATYTLNANDGIVNPQVGSGTIDITAENDAPTAAGVPGDVIVTEDTANDFDLSAVTFDDIDGDNLVVTLDASAGTFAATSGGSVTIGGTGTGTLTLSGTAADINTYLDTISNIQYTGASNASGTDAANYTLNANDGIVNPQVGSGTIDITAVNDEPTLVATGTDNDYTVGGGDFSVFTGTSISTIESGQSIQGLTIKVSGVEPPTASNEKLKVGGTEVILGSAHLGSQGAVAGFANLTVSQSGNEFTLVFTGGSNTATDVVNLIDGLAYRNDGSATFNDRIVEIVQLVDSGGTLNGGDPTLDLSGVTSTLSPPNAIPTVDLNGLAAGSNYAFDFFKGDAATTIVDAGAVVVDANDTSLVELRLRVSGVVDGANEQLTVGDLTWSLNAPDFTNATVDVGGQPYTVGWVAGTGIATITLNSGEMSLAQAEAVLLSTQYQHTDAATPTAGDRNIDVAVHDGEALSTTVTTTITVLNNTAPVAGDDPTALDGPEDTVSGILNGVLLGNDIDPDAGDTKTIIQINSTVLAGGIQTIPVTNGTVHVDASNNITFEANAHYNGLVSFDYTMRDTAGATDTATASGTISPVNDAPTMSAGNANPLFVGGGGSVDVFNSVSIDTVEPGQTVSGFTLVIDGIDPPGALDTDAERILFDGAEILLNSANVGSQGAVGDFADLTVTQSGANEFTLVFSGGTANPGNLATDIDALRYRHGDNIPSGGDRQFQITQLVDSGGGSDTANLTGVTATARLDALPVLSGAGGTLVYTEGDGAQIIDASLTLLDPDDAQMDGATITISGGYVMGEDVLSFTPVGGIAGSFDSATGILTLSGSEAKANYVTALESVTYTNTNLLNPDEGPRTITWEIINNSGVSSSAPITSDITVTGANDAPTASGVPGDVVVTEDTLSDFDLSGVTFDDVDGDSLVITLEATAGTFTVSSGGSVTVGGSGSNILTLDGTAADINTFLDTTSNIQYTGAANVNGIDAATYTINAGDGSVNPLVGSGTIDISALNDDPDASADSYSVDEDVTLTTTLATGVLANDNDLDGDTLTVTTTPVSGPSNGGLTLNADGTFSYTPNADFNGTDSFVYGVTDGNGGTAQATATITVNPINDDPTAVADSYSVNEDGTLTTTLATGVLANDNDLDGDTLTVTTTPVSGPSNGGLTLNADGTFTYTPNTDFNGTDSFVYEVTDGNGGSAQATATITVNPINDDPTAVADSYSVDEDGALTTTLANGVLANDNDLDGDTLTVTTTPVSGPSNGGLTLNADGTFTYTPNTDFNGTDSFVYEVTDGNGGSAQATATITVNPINDDPTAVADSYSVDEDGALTTTLANGVLANDNDLDGDTLTVTTTPVSGPSNGGLTLNAVGTFTYTPNTDFNGTDSFVYEVTDGNGGTAQATATITVNPINDDPTAVADSYSVNEDGTLTTTLGIDDLKLNDSDLDGDTLTVTTTPVSGPSNGGLTLNADGTFSYTPNADFNGTDSFVYGVTDGNGGTAQATATITVNPINDDPTAVADSYSVNEDGTLTTTLGIDDLKLNDSDLDGDTLTVTTTPVSGPSNGGLTLNADGTFTYTPNADFNGTDSFVYGVTDGNGGTAQATATITVNPINDDPTAVADSYSLNEDGTLTTTLGIDDLKLNDSDLDGDTLTVTTTPVSGPSNGGLTLNADGTFTYTPNADFNGTDSFVYEVTDGNGGSAQATATITVNPINDGPDAIDDPTVLDGIQDLQSGVLNTTLLGNDTDPDSGDTQTITQINGIVLTPGIAQSIGVTNGTVDVTAAGDITFTPTAGYVGPASFTYTVEDAAGGADTAIAAGTIAVSVSPPNAVDDPEALNGAEDKPSGVLNGVLLANDTDPDTGDTRTITGINGVTLTGGSQTIAVTNGTVNVDASDNITFLPAANFVGAVSFDYTIEDSGGQTDTGTASGTISNLNDAPTGGISISGTAAEDETLSVDLSGLSDADSLGTPSYEWFRDGVSVSTGAAYLLGDEDVGASITAQVSYVDGGGTAESLSSGAVGPIANTNDAPTGAAVVSGDALEGETLSVDASSIDDDDGMGALSYQWLRDGTPVAGANGSSYLLGTDDVGATISLAVSYTDVQGTAESLTSNSSAPVTALATEPDQGSVNEPGTTTAIPTDPGNSSGGGSGPVVTPPVADAPQEQVSASDPTPEPQADPEPEPTTEEPAADAGDGESEASGDSDVALDPRLIEQGQNNIFASGFSSSGTTADIGSVVLDVALDDGQVVRVALFDDTRNDLREQSVTEVDVQVLAFERLRDMSGSLGDIDAFIRDGGFADGIDQLREDVNEEARLQKLVVGSGFAISGSLSVGYVIWAARSGILLSSLLSTMPAWRFIDPFPVLSTGNLLTEEDEHDESLASIAAGEETADESDEEEAEDA